MKIKKFLDKNQFGDFIDLDPDPYSSYIVDPDTINPDPHLWWQPINAVILQKGPAAA